MNNAYFEKNTKLQNRNRAGMIRSYRTARTFAEVLAMILDMLLSVIDRGLDILARSAASRLLRGCFSAAPGQAKPLSSAGHWRHGHYAVPAAGTP